MRSFFAILALFFLSPVLFAQDPGMQSIGVMSVKLIFATNEDPKAAGDLAQEVAAPEVQKLQAIKELNFSEYRLLGTDTPNILKGYESWATPLRPSKEILVSFQPIKRAGDGKVQMVLEYWQSKRKIFSTNPTLSKGKTLYLLGPAWRKGRLILAVKIEKLKN
ncbi:MAG: hypothetical protein ACJAVK_002830 [Akkermansiaceae bacterium]|jgi:hypothetical protein